MRELSVFLLKRERGLQTNTDKNDTNNEPEVTHLESEAKYDPEPGNQPSTSTLQAWFPLWGGWYTEKDPTQTEPTCVRYFDT